MLSPVILRERSDRRIESPYPDVILRKRSDRRIESPYPDVILRKRSDRRIGSYYPDPPPDRRYILPMPRDRRDMTVRVVSLHSREASDARVEGTAAERIALVAELSKRLWAATGRPLPTYTRATMPIVLTTLHARSDRD